MSQDKSFLDQLTEGINNAFGIDENKTTPVAVKTIQQGKGVLLPKLTPVPTVKMGNNPNTQGMGKDKAIADKISSNDKVLLNKLNQIEAQLKKSGKIDAQLQKRINHNRRRIAANSKGIATNRRRIAANTKKVDATQKLINQQKRWVTFMLNKWAKKNERTLMRLNSKLRKKLITQQAVFLKSEAAKRVFAPKNNTCQHSCNKPVSRPVCSCSNNTVRRRKYKKIAQTQRINNATPRIPKRVRKLYQKHNTQIVKAFNNAQKRNQALMMLKNNPGSKQALIKSIQNNPAAKQALIAAVMARKQNERKPFIPKNLQIFKNRPRLIKYRPQILPNRPRILKNMPKILPNRPRIFKNPPRILPNRPRLFGKRRRR